MATEGMSGTAAMGLPVQRGAEGLGVGVGVLRQVEGTLMQGEEAALVAGTGQDCMHRHPLPVPVPLPVVSAALAVEGRRPGAALGGHRRLRSLPPILLRLHRLCNEAAFLHPPPHLRLRLHRQARHPPDHRFHRLEGLG